MHYKAFIKIVIPNILISVMTPLIEIVDLMVVGNSGHVACMAGIGIAISILNIFTWFFGNNISICTSQAVKIDDGESRRQVLYDSILGAGLVGIVFIFIKTGIWALFIHFFKIENIVKMRGYIYYRIVSWSMPFMLINNAIIGWLTGLGRIKPVLILQSTMNILNLILNIVFVNGFNVDLEAVAFSTVVIHMFISIVSLIFILKDLKGNPQKKLKWQVGAIIKFVHEHKDIMIQSICAIIMNMMITIASSYLGSIVLAGNVVLLQIQSLFIYLYNGFSITIADFTKYGFNEGDTELIRTIEESCMTAIMYGVIFFVLIYRLGCADIVKCFTNIKTVQETVSLYDGWLTMYIVVASWGLGLQGIYRGRDQEGTITRVNVIGLIVFIAVFRFLNMQLGNHGLWLDVIIFQLIRSILLMALGG